MTRLDSNNHFIFFFLVMQMAFSPGCASTSDYQGSREQFDDIVITAKVHEAILNEPSLRPYEINVSTVKGVVELSGIVETRDEMERAVAIARSIKVKGIRLIKNDIRLLQRVGDHY
ncbi:BON domain-containing protein [Nitrosomonas sp. Nm166]|uniref:BON domain-containing protein n=1 Tax=Nitrosomonas sp. Nm166 TaxID=1881054 RepID=UPI0008E4DEF3|nr:BON domain-containing protein [Nitrosomonas sp. Nm166]SFD97745.1 BON domain-containing protein [Nitrosomonas sp. Nm166]